MSDLKTRIRDILMKPQLAAMANTTMDGKPWVRYVMTLGDEALNLRLATSLKARKVEQIRKDAEVHITCGISDPDNLVPYLQVQGKASLTTDESERHGFWNPMLEHVFDGPDDSNYAIVVVKPYRIEYVTPGSMTPEVWTSE